MHQGIKRRNDEYKHVYWSPKQSKWNYRVRHPITKKSKCGSYIDPKKAAFAADEALLAIIRTCKASLSPNKLANLNSKLNFPTVAVGLAELTDACNYTEQQFEQQEQEPEQQEPEQQFEQDRRVRARVCITTDTSNIDIVAYEDLVLDIGGSRMKLSFDL